MPRGLTALRSVLLTLWVGGLWVVGYLVVPVLFAVLDDRQLAGTLAGKIFALIGWVGFIALTYLLACLFWEHRTQAPRKLDFWVMLSMGIISASSLFCIQPLMEQLKVDAMPLDVMSSVLRDRFVTWHGVSSILYLLQSLLGLVLVVRSGRERRI